MQGNLRADLSQEGDTLTIRQLAATGFGGLSLQGQGSLGSVGTALELKLDAPQRNPQSRCSPLCCRQACRSVCWRNRR